MGSKDVFHPAPARRLRSVFAPVPTVTFTAAQFAACKNFLAQRSSETEAVPVVDEQQLLLASDGSVLESGYRFNAIGFAAVANTLSVGLNSVFNDLAGETRYRVAASVASGDLAAAVSIFNSVLRARFENVRERTILVNHTTKTIEGFLGIEHRLLDNSVFLNLVAEETIAQQPTAEFYRAELIGRELRIYYADMATKRTNIYSDPRHTFAAGWYFSNREDTGFAIRASNCLLTKFGAAVDSAKRGANVRHTGADLLGRTALLVNKTVTSSLDMDFVAAGVQHMSNMSLGFSATKSVYDAAVEHWVQHLARYRVGKDDAKQICKNAAAVGADLDPRDALEVYTKEVLATRTLYDLFCSMLRYSRSQYHTTRDLLQNVAMMVLQGK